MIYNFTTAAATAAVLIFENGLRTVHPGKAYLPQAGLQLFSMTGHPALQRNPYNENIPFSQSV
jgi:hypothetical protein